MGKYTEEHIDRFINNEMPYAERETFCEVLEKDPDLRSKLKLRQLIIDAVQCEAEKDVRKALMAGVNAKRKRILGQAILLAAVLAGVVFFIGKTYKHTTEEIYAECFYIPYFEYSRSGSGLSEEDATVNRDLVALYEKKEYDKVVKLYKATWNGRDVNQLPAASLLNVCVSALNTGQVSLATPILTKLKNPEYQDKIDWFLLCCYLKEDKRQEAIQTANKIMKESEFLSDRAFQILIKLDERKWFGK